tara:strand:- start:697 stop:2331 length:1635 start_codon:yes stop_codon:yes gene_type:complete
MNILYLVNKNTYFKKMSRIRFHSIKALSNITYVKYWGLNWANYNNNLSVQENINTLHIKFDIVIVYKPLELKNFKDINLIKCIRYNEMWDVKWTLKEIEDSGSQLVICHHLNDCQKYQNMNIPNVKFIYIGHCADKNIFKNYNLKNEYDVFLAGAIGNYHYPLRNRFLKILNKLNEKGYKCLYRKHPGYEHSDSYTDKYLIEYATYINKSKIVLACSSKWKYRLGKYIEIPMCNSAAICGDIPTDNADNYNYVIEIHNNMNDEQIIQVIEYYLNNEKERIKKVKNGIEFSNNYTQEKYANKLLSEIHLFIKNSITSNNMNNILSKNELLSKKLPSGKLLSEKLNMSRRYNDLNAYINKYLFESKQYNYKNNYIIDLGPGPGDFLKIFRDDLKYPNIKGYDARLDSIKGMGKNYVNLCYHYAMENNIPIEYCNFEETGFSGIKDNSVFIINSRGSFEQIFSKYLLGTPHHITHKSDQTWSHTTEMYNKLKKFFIDCSNILVNNGILLIAFNGTKCKSLQNIINKLLPDTLVIQQSDRNILKLIKI